MTTDAQLYSTKISFGDRVGADGEWHPGPLLELLMLGGNCTYVAREIDAPALVPRF